MFLYYLSKIVIMANKSKAPLYRTVVIDNGTKYMGRLKEQVIDAARNEGVNDNHELVTIDVKDLQEAYKKGDAGILKGANYVISSGSGKYRKIDAELHKFVDENMKKDATFLGVCHGAQQYAIANGAELKKTDYFHKGTRRSKINNYHPALEGSVEDGQIKTYGNHKWILPSKSAGSNLEIIAESDSPTGEKFIEMYGVKGKKNRFGAQFHPEMGKSKVIGNLFRSAIGKKQANDNYGPSAPKYQEAA